jgi:hypothetical protein
MDKNNKNILKNAQKIDKIRSQKIFWNNLMKKIYTAILFSLYFISLNAMATGPTPTMKIILSDPTHICKNKSYLFTPSVTTIQSISNPNEYGTSSQGLYINTSTYTDISLYSGPYFDNGYKIIEATINVRDVCGDFSGIFDKGSCNNSHGIVERLNQNGENLIVATPIPRRAPWGGWTEFTLNCTVNGHIVP